MAYFLLGGSDSLRKSVVIFLSLATASSVVYAEPLTLRFETEIDNAILEGEVEKPFVAQLGNQVKGTFTFLPEDLETSPQYPRGEFVSFEQKFPAEFEIDEIKITVPQYVLKSRDDSTPADSDSLTDLLSLTFNQCLEAGCIMADVDGADEYRLESIRLILTGPGTILQGPDLPADVESWNQLASGPRSGRISISFISLDRTSSATFSASIQEFTVIPEPKTAILCCLALIASCTSTRYLD